MNEKPRHLIIVPSFVFILLFICLVPFYTVSASEIPESLQNSSLTSPDGGSGTLTDPYTISSINQLQYVYSNPDKCYLLTDDLDFSEITYNFAPIPNFSGVFDGNNKKILNFNLTYNPPLPQIATPSFFSAISSDGVVKNLTFITPQVINHGRGSAAVLAGSISGTIQNISILGGTVTSTFNQEGDFVGAFATQISGTVENCYSNTAVTGYTSGGFAGTTNGSDISNSYFEGSVTGYSVGGIAGWTNSGCTLEDCFVSATLNGSENTGGIFGLVRLIQSTSFSIQNVYWDTTKSGTVSSVGIIENYVAGTAPSGMVGLGIPAAISFNSSVAQQLTLTTVDLPTGGNIAGSWGTTPFYSNVSVSSSGNVTPLYNGTSPVTYTVTVGTNQMILTTTATITNLSEPPRTLISKLNSVKYLLNGIYGESDVTPVIVNSTSMVPVRLFSNALGYDVEWDSLTNNAVVTNQANGNYFSLISGSNIVYGYDSNGTLTGTYTLTADIILIDGRLYVPISFCSQCLGYQTYNVLHSNDQIYIIVSNRQPAWTGSELTELCNSASIL